MADTTAPAAKNPHCNVPMDQFSEADWESAAKRTLPGTGFCTNGMRRPTTDLRKLIAEDQATLDKLGVTRMQLASAMVQLLEAFVNGTPVPRNLTFSVYPNENVSRGAMQFDFYGVAMEGATVGWMGSQTCPFKNEALDSKYHGYHYGCSDICVKNCTTGEELQFSTLLVHMIAQHGFFEDPLLPGDVTTLSEDSAAGKPNPWRVDPAKTVAFLAKALATIPPEGDAALLAPQYMAE